MKNEHQQRFCPQCGTPTPESSRFCATCGRQVDSAPQESSSSTSHQRPKPRYGVILGVFAALAIVAAAAGFSWGWWQSSSNVAEVYSPTDEQLDALTGYGQPDAWVLADGPTTPGGAEARVEEWFHHDHGTLIVFVNGTATDAQQYTPYDGVAPPNPRSPVEFDSSLSRDDIEQMLAEKGKLIDGVSTAFDGYEAYEYTSARLLIGYLNGMFYTAQTF